jgi:GNAT superfamily N-acetyltransferase
MSSALRPFGGVFRIVHLSPADYVRDVLPHTADMWSGDLTFEAYAAEFEELCASGFGRRRFKTLGLHIDGELVTSCKRYQRELRCGDRTFRTAGIGAVFTPEHARGRGYATAFLGALLDDERAAGTDFVYLFSDIHPAFYERLGFIALPSRAISLRADTLPHARIAARSLTDDDWPAIERCFTTLDATRPFALTRPPLVWDWIRMRARSREAQGVLVRLGIFRGKRLVAYVLGRRFPAADSFALDEFAAIDFDASAQLPSLIRNAAGDLRKITGWLPPDPARTQIPRGAVRTRKAGITMVVPLSAGARAAWERSAETVGNAASDPCWNADHV